MKALHLSILGFVILFMNFNAVHGSFYGICYSPFEVAGGCRSAAGLEQDVALMLEHTTRIRLYSVECPDVMHALLSKASNGQLSLLLGVWIENSPRDQQELELLVEYLTEYPFAAIEGIVIGNEVLMRGQATPEYMAYFVTEARNRVRGLGISLGSQMLQTVDVFSVEGTPHPTVVAVSDAVGVNIQPFYDFTLPHDGAPQEIGEAGAQRYELKLNEHRSNFPGKKIVVTEVGWPSSSDSYSGDNQVGSDLIQLSFIEAFLDIVAQDPVPYYFFEFHNADWKKAVSGFRSGAYSEYNFGIFDSENHPKIATSGDA